MRSLLPMLVFISLFTSCEKEEEKVHEISSIAPEAGLVGSEVTILGSGFSQEIGKNIVTLSGQPVEVLSESSTAIVVEVPEGARSGKFSVSINDKIVYSAKDFVVQYLPEVEEIVYSEGPEGMVAYIYVQHAGNTPSENSMKIGNASVQITKVDVVQRSENSFPTQVIEFIVPNASSGPLTLTANGLQGTLLENFRIYPIIDSFNPKGGVEGDIITITGKNFSSVLAENTVKLDNPGSLTLISSTPSEIKAVVPANARFGRLSVDYSSGPMFAKDYFIGPVINSITPTAGPVGTWVNVYPFFSISGVTTPVVKFNGVTAVEVDLTQGIKARVPVGATTGKVTITHNGFTATSSSTFTVQ